MAPSAASLHSSAFLYDEALRARTQVRGYRGLEGAISDHSVQAPAAWQFCALSQRHGLPHLCQGG